MALLSVQPLANRQESASSSARWLQAPGGNPDFMGKFPFDGSIFPIGAIHMSTLPHWQYFLKPISESRPQFARDLRQTKEIGMNTVVAHID
jgi:hypothetical protein